MMTAALESARASTTTSATVPQPVARTIEELADACRSIALGFVAGVAQGWDKRRLVDWLDSYASVVVASAGDGQIRHGRPTGSVSATRLDALLAEVRDEVVDVVLALHDPERGLHFGFYAVVSGLVTAHTDPTGAVGWAPVSMPRMSLLDRVLSLVAVDYLVRPREYETRLVVCPRCDGVEMHDHGSEGADSPCCRACLRRSGITLVAGRVQAAPLGAAG